MSYKVGDIVFNGSRYGVITKEPRPVSRNTCFGPTTMNLFEVEWLNGKSKGKREDLSWFYDAKSNLDRARKTYERAQKAYDKAVAEAAKVTI